MKSNEFVAWRIVDGKLHTIHAQADALGLRIQLGAIPPTAWHQKATLQVVAAYET